MRIAVIGAGGVGGLIGGFLAHAGVEVAFVARGANLEALRRDGLRVESTRGTFHVPKVDASDDPSALTPADVVLVAVKGWQVAEIAPRLAPLLASGGIAVPLENGVEAEGVIAASLGRERVAVGVCQYVSWLEKPGKIRHIGDRLLITVGARTLAVKARLDGLAATLRAAHVDVAVADDIDAVIWQKFLFIAAYGGVGAVTRAPVGVLRSTPETRALLRSSMEEIAALARTRGVDLPPDAVDRALQTIDASSPEATASMQRDIQAGRPSELHDQLGAVVRLAAHGGVDVPVNRFLFAALLPQEQAARSSGA